MQKISGFKLAVFAVFMMFSFVFSATETTSPVEISGSIDQGLDLCIQSVFQMQKGWQRDEDQVYQDRLSCLDQADSIASLDARRDIAYQDYVKRLDIATNYFCDFMFFFDHRINASRDDHESMCYLFENIFEDFCALGLSVNDMISFVKEVASVFRVEVNPAIENRRACFKMLEKCLSIDLLPRSFCDLSDDEKRGLVQGTINSFAFVDDAESSDDDAEPAEGSVFS